MTVWKVPADVATTEALGPGPAFPASGKIDGVTLKAGDRVLVKDQLASKENGYYVATGPAALTLMPTDDTIEAEDVIGVNQGDRNGHTAWALIDATERTFVRRDVKHYSLKSVAALKQLWQVLPDATATVVGYAEPGDRGGGDFTFIEVPNKAQVTGATVVNTPIDSVTDVDGLVTITTSLPHGLGDPGNVTTVFISGVKELKAKAYMVAVVNDVTFTIMANLPISGAEKTVDAKIQYVRLVTFAPHGRATGQRISVSGVEPLNGAADICKKPTDLSGVIDGTTLSIPIETTGGNYKPGSRAVIGDDALTVPATDPTGTFGGLWQRLRPAYFDVRWFGAKGDWDPDKDQKGKATDDLPAFVAALGTMAAGGNKTNKLVADGHFFLSDTLVLRQTVVLEGTGQNEPPPFFASSRSTPGTMLVFPKNMTGIRIRSGWGLDNPTKTYGNPFPPSGEKTFLRNLTVCCKDIDARAGAKECRDQEEDCIHEGHCIHGIHSSAVVRLDNVTVQFFAHDGIHIVGAECRKTVLDCKPKLDENGNPVLGEDGKPVLDCTEVLVYDGNADGSYVENCIVGNCGRDGFHFRGGDAQACVISCCSGVGNGRAGFYDETFGNTYLGCHSSNNKGPNYITESEVNASVFINCWSEDGSPPSRFKGAITIISGKIGGDPKYMTKDSSAFILEHGVAKRAPFVYQNLNPDAAKSIGCSLGNMNETNQGHGTSMVALNWATLGGDGGPDDNTWLRYLDKDKKPDAPEIRGRLWWALINNDDSFRHMIRFPTMRTNARQPAPWFVNGIFLGRDDYGPPEDPDPSTPKVSFTAAPTRPDTQYNSGNGPLTYERGDVVWNSNPSLGKPIGQVCIASGTQGTLNGGATTGSITNDTTELTVNEATQLEIGQYITITGVSAVKKIVGLEGLNVTIDKASDATVAGAAVAFSPGAFAQFGRVEVIGTTIDPANNYPARAGERVVIRTAGNTVMLPSMPVDGDTVEVLNMSGGNATIDPGAKTIYAAPVPMPPFGDDVKRTFTWIGGAVNQWKAS